MRLHDTCICVDMVKYFMMLRDSDVSGSDLDALGSDPVASGPDSARVTGMEQMFQNNRSFTLCNLGPWGAPNTVVLKDIVEQLRSLKDSFLGSSFLIRSEVSDLSRMSSGGL